jgi:DNA sulfur modification protein DndB
MESIFSLSELLAEQKTATFVEIQGVLGHTFGQQTLSTTLAVSKLLNIYEVDLEVQRSIIPRNLSKLIDYVHLYLDHGQPIYFPGIIFSARGAGEYDQNTESFKLQPIEKLYVVDGQHRLAAFQRVMELLQSQMARAKDRREYDNVEIITEKLRRLYAFPISTMIYLDMNAKQERQLFSDINKLPRKIAGNLAVLRDQRRFYHVIATSLVKQSPAMTQLKVDMFTERGKSPDCIFSYHLLIEILIAIFEGRMKTVARNNHYIYEEKDVTHIVEQASEYFSGLLFYLPEPRKGEIVWTENIQISLALFFHHEATKTGKFNSYVLTHVMKILPHIPWGEIYRGDEKDRLPRRSRITKAHQFIKNFYEEHHLRLIQTDKDVI